MRAIVALLMLLAVPAAAEMDAEAREVLRDAILAADYVCPEVGRADVKGQTHEGIRIKAWCRPSSGSDVYSADLIYCVTVRPSGLATVKPSSLLGC